MQKAGIAPSTTTAATTSARSGTDETGSVVSDDTDFFLTRPWLPLLQDVVTLVHALGMKQSDFKKPLRTRYQSCFSALVNHGDGQPIDDDQDSKTLDSIAYIVRAHVMEGIVIFLTAPQHTSSNSLALPDGNRLGALQALQMHPKAAWTLCHYLMDKSAAADADTGPATKTSRITSARLPSTEPVKAARQALSAFMVTHTPSHRTQEHHAQLGNILFKVTECYLEKLRLSSAPRMNQALQDSCLSNFFDIWEIDAASHIRFTLKPEYNRNSADLLNLMQEEIAWHVRNQTSYADTMQASFLEVLSAELTLINLDDPFNAAIFDPSTAPVENVLVRTPSNHITTRTDLALCQACGPTLHETIKAQRLHAQYHDSLVTALKTALAEYAHAKGYISESSVDSQACHRAIADIAGGLFTFHESATSCPDKHSFFELDEEACNGAPMLVIINHRLRRLHDRTDKTAYNFLKTALESVASSFEACVLQEQADGHVLLKHGPALHHCHTAKPEPFHQYFMPLAAPPPPSAMPTADDTAEPPAPRLSDAQKHHRKALRTLYIMLFHDLVDLRREITALSALGPEPVITTFEDLNMLFCGTKFTQRQNSYATKKQGILDSIERCRLILAQNITKYNDSMAKLMATPETEHGTLDPQLHEIILADETIMGDMGAARLESTIRKVFPLTHSQRIPEADRAFFNELYGGSVAAVLSMEVHTERAPNRCPIECCIC